MSKARLPAIVIPSSGDAAVINALRAIAEHLEVWRGSRGDQLETVLTRRDLKEMGLFRGYAGGPSGSVGAVLTQGADGRYTPVDMNAMFKQFADALYATSLYKSLVQRIDDPARFEHLPEQVRMILLKDLNQLASELNAQVRRLETSQQEQDRSFASQVTEVTAALERATAGVRQTLFAYADQNRSTAGAVTQVVARLDDVGGGASVEEAMTAIADRATGLEAQYTLKANAGGAFAAIGLAATETTAGVGDSHIIFVADNFAFVKPTDVIGTGPGEVDPTNPGASRIPFGIDSDGTIYLNGQVRINTGGTAVQDIANLTFIGNFASAPVTTTLKKNNVYKNTTDGNSYILTADAGSWTLFVPKGDTGATGSTGSTGSAGSRGSLTLYTSGSSWSDATANSAITSATGSSTSVIGDTVTISNGTSFAATKYWSGSAWVDPGVIINGNLLVTGTVSANVLNGGTISGVTINIGSGAFIVNSAGAVTALSGVVGGVGYFTATSGSSPGLTGTSSINQPSVYGYTASGNTNGNAHAVRGIHSQTGAGGLIGGATGLGYDFYADGSGTNYGPFTGTHDAVTPNAAPIEPGEIVVDVACISRKGWSGTLFEVAPSSQPNQSGALGVVCAPGRALSQVALSVFVDRIDEETGMPVMNANYDTYKDSYTALAVNAVGEGQMNVCGEGGNIEIGDLIVTSSIPGKGMKQSDDIVRGCTVAKAREAVTFDSPTQVKIVACIYMCG